MTKTMKAPLNPTQGVGLSTSMASSVRTSADGAPILSLSASMKYAVSSVLSTLGKRETVAVESTEVDGALIVLFQ